MYHGPYVYVTKGSNIYHYTDDDCPVTTSIHKGRKFAEAITEEQALQMGLKLCRYCAKEYWEDQAKQEERKSIKFSVYLWVVIAVGMMIISFLLSD